MKKSCNGCRVLRKACNDNCSIRPCLQWIQDSRSQANATQFLAKFYGRSNFINFIDAAPHDQRPAIFRSLLYEASGRIVNPIYGSVGLLSSGKWRTCQMAVEAVLKGEDITHSNIDGQASMPPATTVSHTDNSLPRSCAYDIRHIHTNKPIGSMKQKQKEFHGIINPSFGEVGFAGDYEKIELDLTLGLDPVSHARSCTGNSPSGSTSSSENYANFPPLAESSDGWTI